MQRTKTHIRLRDEKIIPLGERTRVMGILNRTPDSFSDGGVFWNEKKAFAQVEEMLADGVDVIDIGGESTRPGSDSVDAKEEMRRIIPLVEAIKKRYDVLVSVDTVKGDVAQRAIDAGADIINDISGFRMDPTLLEVVAKTEVPVIMMHMQGTPRTMQENPVYENVVTDVCAFLHDVAHHAMAHGVAKDKIIVDPGIGFGKTKDHNWQLIAGLEMLSELGFPVLMAASRKAFLRKLLMDIGDTDELSPLSPQVDLASHAVVVASILKGAHVVRVHDVKGAKIAASVADAILCKGERHAVGD